MKKFFLIVLGLSLITTFGFSGNTTEEEKENPRVVEAKSAAKDMKFRELSESYPVAINSMLHTFKDGKQGIITRIKIMEGFHIYSFVEEGEPFEVTTIRYRLPQRVTLSESILPAENYFSQTKTMGYEKEAMFIQMLNGKAAKWSVTVECIYQACDAYG